MPASTCPAPCTCNDRLKLEWTVPGHLYDLRVPEAEGWGREELSTARSHMCATLHTEYRDRNVDKRRSPVGTYFIDCDELDDPHPQQPSLSIRTTSLPGVYQASYNFGHLLGPMMMSTDKKLLAYFCGLDGNDDDDENTGHDEAEDEAQHTDDDEGDAPEDDDDSAGEAAAGTAEPKRKPVVFHTVMRSLCIHRDRVNYRPMKGTLTFGDSNYDVFLGITDMDYVGEDLRDVSYFGGKISREPSYHLPWEDFASGAASSDWPQRLLGAWGDYFAF